VDDVLNGDVDKYMKKQWFAQFVLIMVVLVWGINTPLLKVGVTYIPPVLYNALRLIMAVLIAWPVLIYSKKYKPFQKKDSKSILILTFTGFIINPLFFALGLTMTTAGNASFMCALLPIIVVIINRIFYHESISSQMAVGIGVSLIGAFVVILGSGKEMSLSGGHLLGTLLILLAQIGSGYYTVFSQELREDYSPYQIITYIMTLSAVIFSVLSIPDLAIVQWEKIPFVAWMSIVVAAPLSLFLCNCIWMWVIGIVGSTEASAYQNLVPIFSIMVSWLFLGENFELIQMVGGVIIFIGLYLTRMKLAT